MGKYEISTCTWLRNKVLLQYYFEILLIFINQNICIMSIPSMNLSMLVPVK